jgi:hypothetical protein
VHDRHEPRLAVEDVTSLGIRLNDLRPPLPALRLVFSWLLFRVFCGPGC